MKRTPDLVRLDDSGYLRLGKLIVVLHKIALHINLDVKGNYRKKYVNVK